MITTVEQRCPYLISNWPCINVVSTPIPTPSAVPSARFRYDIQKAEAYQMSLASELQQHFITLVGSI